MRPRKPRQDVARLQAAASALADVIERHRRVIEATWLTRVEEEVDRKDTNPALLRDGMPDYLTELVRLLRSPVDVGSAAKTWSTVAEKHGLMRVRIGFDIRQLLQEFIFL